MKASTAFACLLAFAAASSASSAFAANYSCKNFAGAVGVHSFEKSEKPQLVEIHNLDKKLEESDTETGIYGVEVSVDEECLDGIAVYTTVVKKNGRPSCKVVKTKHWMDRDCG